MNDTSLYQEAIESVRLEIVSLRDELPSSQREGIETVLKLDLGYSRSWARHQWNNRDGASRTYFLNRSMEYIADATDEGEFERIILLFCDLGMDQPVRESEELKKYGARLLTIIDGKLAQLGITERTISSMFTREFFDYTGLRVVKPKREKRPLDFFKRIFKY